MKNKGLDYYLSLNYELILRRIDSDDGSFYEARISELDPLTFYGTGGTVQKAIADLEEVKCDMFQYYLDHDIEITEPTPSEEELPSGRLLLRLSPQLHYRLMDQAKRSKQSLNSYLTGILQGQYSTKVVLDKLEERLG